MYLKTDYKFNGLEIQDAQLHIARIWGAYNESWTTLVSVCIESGEGEEKVLSEITQFNHTCIAVANERGYETSYKSLLAEFGGELLV